MPIDTIARAVYNSGKDEWERFVSNIAVPVVNTLIDPLWKSSDSIERTLATVERTGGPTKPQLDVPLPMDEKTFELGKAGLTKFVEPLQIEDDSSTTDIDELVHDLLLTLARDSSIYLQAKRDYFNLERKWGESKEIERTAELQNQVDATKTVNTWGKVEQSVASAGLIISGALAVASGGAVGLGIGAIALGAVLLIDQLLDDAVKKTVAKWIARGDREEETAWVNRIQMFAGLSSFALSFGTSPSAAVQVAMDVSKGAVGSIKDVFQWRLAVQKSTVMQLDADTKISQKMVDTLFTEIQEICNEINQFHENLHHIEEKKQKVAHSMLKFADA